MRTNNFTLYFLLLFTLSCNFAWAQKAPVTPPWSCGFDFIQNADPNIIRRNNIQPQFLDDNTTVYVPVVFHVIDEDPNVLKAFSNPKIFEDRINIFLNPAFNGDNPFTKKTIPAAFMSKVGNSKIRFCLAGVTYTLSSVTEFSCPMNQQNEDLESWGPFYPDKGGIARWNPQNYLNIYICRIAMPCTVAITKAGEFVIISSYYFLPRPEIMIHETGHYFNLLHLWGNDQFCSNDFVDDTPKQYGPTACMNTEVNFPHKSGNCPADPNDPSPNDANGDMYMNFMDYTCNLNPMDPLSSQAIMFTKGQCKRMRAFIEEKLPNLLKNKDCNKYVPCWKDKYEPNNSYAQASLIKTHGLMKNQITRDISHTGSICVPLDVDYYKFILTKDSIYRNIKIYLSDLPTDLDLHLLKKTGLNQYQEIQVSEQLNFTKEVIKADNLGDGEYIIKVLAKDANYANPYATYKLTVGATYLSSACANDMYEPNDTYDDADLKPIHFTTQKINNIDITYSARVGAICPQDDEDEHTLIVGGEGDNYTIELTGWQDPSQLPADFDIAIYDEDGGVPVYYSYNKGTANELIFNEFFKPGKYHISVAGVDGSYSNSKLYKLYITKGLSNANGKPHLLPKNDNNTLYTLYPNPANSSLNIKLNVTGLVKVELTNMYGNIVYNQQHKVNAGNTIIIPTSALKQDIYLLRLYLPTGEIKQQQVAIKH